jgi:hypothetical protein
MRAIARTLTRGACALALVLAATGTALAAGPAASAQAASGCSLSSHCYGAATWFSAPANYGSGGNIYFGCLYSANPSTNFTDEEMWQGTDNSTGLGYWVELGGSYGWPNGATRYWFWADNRPNGGGYHAHYPGGTLSLGVYYGLEVIYDGANKWTALGPAWSGTSTGNPASGRALEAGAEITDNVAHAVGHVNVLYRFDTSYDTIRGWSGAAIPIPNPPVTSVYWVSSAHNDLDWSTGSCS